MGTHHITHSRSCNKLFAIGLVRHPPVGIPAGICYGRIDVPLAPGWEGWADILAERLIAIMPTRIWSSPSSRCASVAARLAGRLDLKLTLDERLRELDFGAWEGQPWSDLPRAQIDRWALDPPGFSPPGGETGTELTGRVAGFTRMLIGQARSCVVLSHGGPLRLLPALLRAEPGDLLAHPPAPGSLEVIEVPWRPLTRCTGS